MSFSRWQKLIAPKTEKAVRLAALSWLMLAAASFTEFPGGDRGFQGCARHCAVLRHGIPSLLWEESGFGPDPLVGRQLEQIELLLRHVEGIVTDDGALPQLEQGATLGGDGRSKGLGQGGAGLRSPGFL